MQFEARMPSTFSRLFLQGPSFTWQQASTPENDQEQTSTEATNYCISVKSMDMSCGYRGAQEAEPNDVIREECKESG